MRLRPLVVFATCVLASACGLVAGFERPEYFDPSDASVDPSEGGAIDEAHDASSDPLATSDAADGADNVDAADAGDAALDAFDANVSCYDRLDGSFDGGTIFFCDDFERATGATTGWDTFVTQNGGTLATTTEASTNGARSLVVEIPSGTSTGEKIAYVQSPTVSVTPLFLEYDFRVEVGPPAGSYPANAFTLGHETWLSGGWKATFIRVESAGQADPIFLVPEPAMPLPQQAWLHMKWSVLGVGGGLQTIDVYDKANPGTVVTRTSDQPQAPKNFWIGALTDTSLGPVKLYVDAVVLHQ